MPSVHALQEGHRHGRHRQSRRTAGGITREEVDALPPAKRERFAALCQHWADFAKLRPAIEPKAGILVQLKGGRQGVTVAIGA